MLEHVGTQVANHSERFFTAVVLKIETKMAASIERYFSDIWIQTLPVNVSVRVYESVM